MAATGDAPRRSGRPRAWYRILYIQVLAAILLGVTAGYLFPHAGAALKPLGAVCCSMPIEVTQGGLARLSRLEPKMFIG